MKLVHKSEESIVDSLAKAKEAEQEDELEKAATLYEKVLKVYDTDEFIYNRLMIIYRKLKEFKKEEALIKKAITTFRNLYSSNKSHNKKVTTLSKALLKSTGLVDKKGESVYEHGPISKWKARLKVVQKKISTQ